MINIILGLIIGLVFFLCLATAFYTGYRMQPQPKKLELDEETKRKAKELQEDFAAIMNYDLSQAMQRKKVI